MFVQTYSYDYVTVLITKKRLRECSLDISLPIETKTSHMHAHPSSNQRSKGCDVYIRGKESLTTSTQDFDFSISSMSGRKMLIYDPVSGIYAPLSQRRFKFITPW